MPDGAGRSGHAWARADRFRDLLSPQAVVQAVVGDSPSKGIGGPEPPIFLLPISAAQGPDPPLWKGCRPERRENRRNRLAYCASLRRGEARRCVALIPCPVLDARCSVPPVPCSRGRKTRRTAPNPLSELAKHRQPPAPAGKIPSSREFSCRRAAHHASRPCAGRAVAPPSRPGASCPGALRRARCSASCLSNIALAAAWRLALNSARLSPHH